VKEEEARLMVIVRTVPIRLEAAVVVIVLARGIVVRTRAEPEERLIFGTTFPVCVVFDAVIAPAAIVFVPSALCGTVTVPVAIVTEEFSPQEYCEEEEYTRSITVTPPITTFAPTLICEK
jgi:hypothetical protein